MQYQRSQISGARSVYRRSNARVTPISSVVTTATAGLNFYHRLQEGLSLKLAARSESTEARSSDILQTVVLAYESIYSTLRPAFVSVDRISERALTIDHTLMSGFDR